MDAADRSDYASFGADQSHFCLLARIQTSTTAPFGMTSPETGNLYANVRNNINIVWKNASIVDTDGAGTRFADIVIGGFDKRRKQLRLRFDSPRKRRGYSLYDGRIRHTACPVRARRKVSDRCSVFELDVTELDAKGTRLGGQRLLLKTPVRCKNARNRHPSRDFRSRNMNAEGRVLLLNY